MFTISKENTVKYLEGSSDIFGNGQTTSFVSEIFDSLREPSEIFWNNAELSWNGQKLLDILNKIILAFLELLLFQIIFYC